MDVLAKERDIIRESGTEQSELKPAQLVLKKLIRPMVRGGCIDIACTEGRKPEFPNSSRSSTLLLGLSSSGWRLSPFLQDTASVVAVALPDAAVALSDVAVALSDVAVALSDVISLYLLFVIVTSHR